MWGIIIQINKENRQDNNIIQDKTNISSLSLLKVIIIYNNTVRIGEDQMNQ
jgi:hypothetical protein